MAILFITKYKEDENALKEPYENRIWFFVKNLIGFLSNLVTAAPKDSPIPDCVLNEFLITNTLVEFCTELTVPEVEESKESEIAVTCEPKAECEAAMLLPMLVFLYNAMVNRKELRAEFVQKQA